MSVYTRLTKEELEQLLSQYDIGNLVNIEGINEGITNSNFYLTTTKSKFILTIFEEPNLNIEYAIDLMDMLSANQINCPIPIKTRKGLSVINVKNKPASIFSLLPGKTISSNIPTINMCKEIGNTIGRIHVNSKKFQKYDLGLRSSNWFEKTSKKLRDVLDDEDINLINKEIENQIYCTNTKLPSGVIHSDLFRDNAMFHNNKLSGVIDFYYACNGYYLYDLAIIVNDWCLTKDLGIDYERQSALMLAYNDVRKIEDLEKDMWPNVLRHAALRFWLSRLHDKFFPTDGEITHQLDPNEFKQILINRIETPYILKI